jgi:hypothetical protein
MNDQRKHYNPIDFCLCRVRRLSTVLSRNMNPHGLWTSRFASMPVCFEEALRRERAQPRHLIKLG